MPTADRAARAIFAVAMAVAWAVAVPAAAVADDWSDAKASGVLRWGGDTEGGGPYIFPDENDPEKNVGFEIELMDAVARFLRVRAEFTQAQWDKLPDMLRGKKVPVIANGLEFTAERVDVMDATIPYYVYGLQLLCPRRAGGCTAWQDLKQASHGRKHKIGVLTGSAAETESRAFCGDACEVITYDGNTDSMREVETGKLDATVQDTPIAAFYGPRFPQLVAVGEPIAPGYYVMYVRKGEAALLHKLNEALVVLTRSGEFERICKKYGIWNKQQAELAQIHASARFFGLYNAVAASSGARADAAGPDAASPTTPTDLAVDPSATTPTTGDATPTAAAGSTPARPVADVSQVETSLRKRGFEVVRAYTPI
ncbi:MAG: amino acid ABC transporter substrate-binding protein, partial [Deltaproteobacteria bacterium]|nr:amino acid ABC transporter substrate-binding protein [Deltaproteobacteria bacterium]